VVSWSFLKYADIPVVGYNKLIENFEDSNVKVVDASIN
jgi:hypothetical protein